MRHTRAGCFVIVAILVLFLPSLVRAQSGGSVFQTGLVTDKSSYKLGETVIAKLILYNPTPQWIFVHFSGGCWYNFVIRDPSGMLVHNETWPACDPNINGLENVTNVMTVEPGGGRWFSTSWNQLDTSGRHVQIPADYVLSWGFRNSDQPILQASKTITLTDQAYSQLDSFSDSAFGLFQFAASWLILAAFFVGQYPSSRSITAMKMRARLMITLPAVVTGIATLVALFIFYPSQLFCSAIECPGTISLINSMNVLLLSTPIVWAVLFLVGRMVSESRIWLPFTVFESWTECSMFLAFMILQSLHELWMNTFYFDWALVLPSYGLGLAFIPVQRLIARVQLKKLTRIAPFMPVPPRTTWEPQ